MSTLQKLPRIASATARGAMCVSICFDNGWNVEVDLTEFVSEFHSLNPLRDANRFACVAVEEWGSGLTWDDEGPLSIAASTLYRLACEQSAAHRISTQRFLSAA